MEFHLVYNIKKENRQYDEENRPFYLNEITQWIAARVRLIVFVFGRSESQPNISAKSRGPN